MGDEPHHLLGGPGQYRYHEHRERYAPGERGEVAHRLHEPGPGENAHHDRWGTVQDVRHEPHGPAEPPGAVLREIESRPDAYRQTDQRGQSHDDQSPDDRVRDAAARLPRRDGILDEKAPIERRRAFRDEMPENQDQ